MEGDFEMIRFPEGLGDKEKEWMLGTLRADAKRKSMVHLLYKPDCGCDYMKPVLLDRYPLTRWILSMCEECGKGVTLEGVDPIQFFIPLTEQVFGLEELEDMVITESEQKYLFERHKE